MTLATGSRIGPYEILAPIGAGGMGEVYRARDTRLAREVAIKVLPAALVADPDRLRRFNLEARAAAQLEHPNIGVVHEIDEVNGTTFIVMELIRGEKLSEALADERLSLSRAVGLATEIAEGLARAHEKGIVHRDLKPANVMVTEDGHAKIIDFGLAKLVEPVEPAASDVDTAARGQTETGTGAVLGTPAYMSPEQARGQRVDYRSDVFSFGVMLYEMLTGGPPFRGPSHVETLHAILKSPAPPLELPSGEDAADLQRILDKCLAKDPAERYQGTRDIVVDLRAARRRLESGPAPPATLPSAPPTRWPLRRPWLAVAALLLLLAALAVAVRFGVKASRARWARNEAFPEVLRLAKEERLQASFRLARRATLYLPDDPQLAQQIKEMTHVTTIDSEPPGARVSFADYIDPKAEWELVGTTPIKETRVPFGLLRWKLTKEGFEESVTLAWAKGGSLDFRLFPKGTVPPGMVTVPAGRSPQWWPKTYELEDSWLDRCEVTNADFKRFVDAGGYEREDNWKEPFVEAGRNLSWRKVMTRFKDKTGRPGPATWTLGSFPEGEADLPVGGVSWYEAAAFAAFAGKSLPTVHHWTYAAGFASPEYGLFSEIWRLSNFGGQGPQPVSRSRGLTAFGAYDMAGNVKEWCWNTTGEKRFIMGGAWNEPVYMFMNPDAASPFERSPSHGFRCARYAHPLSPELLAPFGVPSHDFAQDRPVGDETFRVYKDLYAYQRRDLHTVQENTEETKYWRHETVSFDAAYGDERVIAHLFLPKLAAPPYQTVIYLPESWALVLKSSQDLDMRWLSFIVRSGRAVLCPVFKGTFERRAKSLPADVYAEWTIAWAKDLGRSIDYLEKRKDIDLQRIAYYSFSLGADPGPVFAVVEKRLTTMILLAGGGLDEKTPPQVNPLNFAPRTRIPVLMINGKDDFGSKDTRRRVFDLLGTPPEHKRLALLDGGHIPARLEDVIREILDWLDRYLGPVRRG